MTTLSLACGLAVLAALVACSSVPKAASTGDAAVPSVASRVAAARAQGLVCDDDNMTGSHMTQRLCLTPEEAKQRHQASQGAAFDAQHQAIPKATDGSQPPSLQNISR
jgi:hypothetical protein